VIALLDLTPPTFFLHPDWRLALSIFRLTGAFNSKKHNISSASSLLVFSRILRFNNYFWWFRRFRTHFPVNIEQ